MGINEHVDSYYGVMQDILQRMGIHLISNKFLMSIFIGGLCPNTLKTYGKTKVALQHMHMQMPAPNFGRNVV